MSSIQKQLSLLFDKRKQSLFVDYLTYQRIRSQVEYYGVALPHRNIQKVIWNMVHNHVSLLIDLGYSPTIVADRIGGTVDTVLKTYSHLCAESKESLSEKLNNLYKWCQYVFKNKKTLNLSRFFNSYYSPTYDNVYSICIIFLYILSIFTHFIHHFCLLFLF